MDLNTVCFLQFGFLFVGFLLLEGFDYGVGMLIPFFGRNEEERRAVIDTLAPVWEGNEVWMVAAGAFLFAGFPSAYATLFSGMYLPLLLILASLILRGVAFEFRNNVTNRKWRQCWDWSIFAGSLIPAVVWGIAIANLLKGVPIDASMQYAGTVWDLFSLYTVIGGLTFQLLFLLHGIAYLALRLDSTLLSRLTHKVKRVANCTLVVLAFFSVLTYRATDIGEKSMAGILLALPLLFIPLIGTSLENGRFVRSFMMSGGVLFTVMAAIFLALYPRLMVSSLSSEWSLDIYNTASNPLTLKIMSITLWLAMPVMMALEAWKYYVFRKRVTVRSGLDIEALTRRVGELRALIAKAYCLVDIMKSTCIALRKHDGNVIDRMQYKYKMMLFTDLPSKMLYRRSGKGIERKKGER